MKQAYLVVDMSNDFVAENGALTAGAPARAITDAILEQIKLFDERNELIVFCMDAHEKNDPHFELWPPHNVVGTYGAQLYAPLAKWYEANKEKPNVIFLPKSEYDAFYKTNLEAILRKAGVEGVRVSGVCTDICVFNTVYGAYKCSFKTIVSEEECATFTGNGEVFLNQMNAIYKTEIIRSKA